ncbi:ComA [Desulfamplus magnetovallimortis]|uniref:ComA n=1 Tax=Desulfamplus magnetovallimortis TaxID=1246637 RepID=A0A1W1HGA1_9BACT|nr:ABC transporter ATP-binding protein/permease [Desulfamplus magnetovallimortis]SLM31412.1 ComA [Desulfamplus magnetovallimortis]
MTDKPLYYWVLKKNRLRQLIIFSVILLSIALQVLPLELQKRIVNIAIKTGDIGLLITYSILFFIAFILFGLLKFTVNMMEARLGQAILYEIRCQLHAHILKLPLNFFRTHPPGTVINALSGELSEVGHFIGGALTVPVTIILTLLAFGSYMIYLDPLLATISLSIYPIEIILIPYLQKKYNRNNQQRISTLRELNDKINESISGIHEIQSNAVFERVEKKFETIAASLRQTINQLFLIKFTIKMINNMFQNTGPLLLFVIGGYLAVHGNFSLGALIAFLSAYEKVYDPWKELIGFYQSWQDASVRYRRVMDTFKIQPEFETMPSTGDIVFLSGRIESRQLSYSVKNGIDLIRNISFSVKPGEHLAIVGFSGSGKSTLAMLIGQLYRYHRGEILMDTYPLKQLSKMDISCNIGYVAQYPYIFDSTIRENILMGSLPECRSGLLKTGAGLKNLDGSENLQKIVENVGFIDDLIKIALENQLPENAGDTHAWTMNDTSPDNPEDQLPEDLFDDLKRKIVSLRIPLRERLDPLLHNRIELFDVEKFLSHTPIYGNLVFSDALPDDLAPEKIAGNIKFKSFLKLHDLYEEILSLGHQIIRQSIVVLKNLADDPYFFKATPIPTEDMPKYEALLEKYPACRLNAMTDDEHTELLALALTYIPAQHKIAVVSAPFQKKIIKFRKAFLKEFINLDYHSCTRAMEILTSSVSGNKRDKPSDQKDRAKVRYITSSDLKNKHGEPEKDQEKIKTTKIVKREKSIKTQITDNSIETMLPVYCPETYIPSRSVMENLLFGSVMTAYASAWPRIKTTVMELLHDNESIYKDLIDSALDYQTGSQGSRLSGGQKQKIALARALVKEPSMLILDEATASLDNQSQQKIQSYITSQLKGRTTVISVIHRLDLLPDYDTILVLKDGKVMEQGSYDELINRKGAFYELVHGQ